HVAALDGEVGDRRQLREVATHDRVAAAEGLLGEELPIVGIGEAAGLQTRLDVLVGGAGDDTPRPAAAVLGEPAQRRQREGGGARGGGRRGDRRGGRSRAG